MRTKFLFMLTSHNDYVHCIAPYRPIKLLLFSGLRQYPISFVLETLLQDFLFFVTLLPKPLT